MKRLADPVVQAVDRGTMALHVLRRAVEDWPQFDRDEPVNGADLVDWFAGWRREAKALLEGGKLKGPIASAGADIPERIEAQAGCGGPNSP